MGYQSIFFRPARGFREYKYDTDGNIISTEATLYQLDGVINEQHSSTARVTKHPVEFGVDLSDYVIRQPQKVIVNGVVTNSPFLKQLANKLPGGAKFGQQAVSTLTGSRVRSAYQGLVELQNKRKPLQLQTGLGTYDNMVLTDVSSPNDLQNNLRVRLVFEEIFIADGDRTGAIRSITNSPPQRDYVSAITTLAGLGIAGLTFATGG